MATVLDLAREVRHRLVSKDTGCLTVDYTGDTVSMLFREGTVAAKRPVFLSCFIRNPVDFQFKPMALQAIEDPGESGLGASVLTEAIEAIDKKSIIRVWEPYAEWRIGSRTDPDLHNTFIKNHLADDVGQLRRLMRLAVSGSVTLEAPRILITDEMEHIEKSFDSGRWHDVLGVHPRSEDSEIKKAYRKLARRFHPDRWVSSGDMKQRDRIERTFQRVSRAYTQLQRPQPASPQRLVGPKPKKSLWRKMFGFVH